MFDSYIRTNQAYLPYTPYPPPKQHTDRCTHSWGYPRNSCVTCSDISTCAFQPRGSSWAHRYGQDHLTLTLTHLDPQTHLKTHTRKAPGMSGSFLTAAEQCYRWYSCQSDQMDTFSQRLVLLFQFLPSFVQSYKAFSLACWCLLLDVTL